jgi:biopolymer transport protein TolR
MLKQTFTEDKPMAEINIVPYVDVMLVLLVIFMITAPLLTSGVQVDLPQTGAATLEEQPDQPLIVSVDNVGNYFLNISETPTTPMMPKDLSLRVAAELARNPERQVLMRGDENVSYGQVVTAMSMLQKAGAPSVGLVTSPIEDDE